MNLDMLMHAQAEAERENAELRHLLQEVRDEAAELRRALVAMAIEAALTKSKPKRKETRRA